MTSTIALATLLNGAQEQTFLAAFQRLAILRSIHVIESQPFGLAEMHGPKTVQRSPISSRWSVRLGRWKLFRALKTQKRNFNPTKYRSLCTGNGIFRTHRTSASVGVLALVIGVGT